jgi:hypothetical protein
MNQFYALLSMVFMIGFVMVFDRVHRAGYLNRFCSSNLLSGAEVEHLRKIAMACE